MTEKSKLLEDIIAELTPEEREQHKELIAECRSRDFDIEMFSKKSLENFEKLAEAINHFYDMIGQYNNLSDLIKIIKDEPKGGIH